MKKFYPDCRAAKGNSSLSSVLNLNPIFQLIFLFALPIFSSNAQTLIWRDEFNQAKVDDEKWTREVGGSGNGNGELQYYTSGEQNVFIGTKSSASDTGYLVIEARRENYGVSPENRQFTSGRINTSGKFNVKYGTIEARIKLPDLQNGLWPAFWMLGANYPDDGWPKSGELDIMEAGFKGDWQAGVANKKTNTTVHWFQDNYQQLDPNAPGDGWWGNASATNDTTISGNFYDGYHTFKLEWTPTNIYGYVDNIKYYTFNIPSSDANITEFSTNPYYIILNLAIGGANFVGITDPAQITAPLPAQMLVDYVRVYSNANTTFYAAQNVARETGTFGVFTETKTVNGSLGANPSIEVWNNLAATTTTAFEGTKSLSFTASAGEWFGLGIPAASPKNMENFVDGSLYFHMKTSSSHPISIGIISTINGNAQASTQSKTVKLDPAGNQYGLIRDGQWHEVKIPLSAFGNIEFRSIDNMFYLVGDAPSASVSFAVDNIYWMDGTKLTPQNGDFVIYSDTKTGVDKFDQPSEGSFNIWETTLVTQSSTPAEGSNVLSFTNNNKGWFGAAFTASSMHNLTAYENSNAKLVFSLKTSDTTTPFYIGMKSGTRDGEGQKWIAFEPGQNPYGFTRNGTWQVVQIPMSVFYESVDLMQVTQLFEILGTGNISNIAIDNIYLTGGLSARSDDGVANVAPTANAGADKTITLPTNSVVINGAGSDSDGSIASYAWTKISGPNTPGLSGANTANLTASNLVAGVYVFRLTVTDNKGATGFDEMTVTVNNSVAPNLALNKQVTVSSSENAGTPGSAAVDGSGTTRWSSAFADPQWIYVDLGATYSVNRVKITWEAAYGKDYQVQISSNTSSWTTIKTVTGNTSLTNDHTGLSGSGRYIRIYGTARGTVYGYSIYELEVYGTSGNVAPIANAGADKSITLPTNSVVINGSGTDSDGSIASYSWSRVSGPNTPTLSGANTANLTASGLVQGTYVFMLTVTDNAGATGTDNVNVVVNPASNVNLALNKTTTVSSTENAGTPGSGAVDGNTGTRWSSAFADPQWIYVDLGATYNVNRVKITWETALGKDYQVQVSSDASSWSTIKTVTGNTSLVNDHTGLSGTGRYIRIYGTARGTVYGYSIYELEVYGSSAARFGSEELDEASVQMYPNPVSSNLNFKGISQNASVVIRSARGSLVLETALINGSVDVSNLPQGIYIISLEDGNNVFKKTFIRQ